ncbi:unnamed protein product [Spirodela intermedia]|uniref:Uncharacterized protein n=1 Tax=Spirodela intermedia TaxID=51605 RepID=A0A7I8JD39_SPIIN|nr:unnamed protein product [Spirodela intermedia]CAA6667443.1 unnamed protein product [Spirodela intermedia]
MDFLKESSPTGVEESHPDWKIIRHPLYQQRSSPWFDLRVFYVRFTGFEVKDSTPEHLTLTHIPLSPNTIIEVNGRRSSIYSEIVSSSLRRDRVDRETEETTFVGTDSIRLTGSMRFEVYDKDDLVLSGALELTSGDGGAAVEGKSRGKTWSIRCWPPAAATAGNGGFLKGRQQAEAQIPAAEVYLTGCFSGSPIILTETLQLGLPKKNQRKTTLDSIPEYEPKDFRSSLLSLFNAGVRVGVGIGLGICLGVGIGVGLLARTYQATARNFKRRIL